MSSPSIAVLGTGALGSPIGGLLTRAGYDVVLIDQWAAHVDAMKAKGLRITVGLLDDPAERFVVPVRAYHLYEVCTLRPRFDIVILTCKSYDTRWLTHFIEPHLKPDGVLISMSRNLTLTIQVDGKDRESYKVPYGARFQIKDGDNSIRVSRGGSSNDQRVWLRSALRNKGSALRNKEGTGFHHFFGVRLAAEVDGPSTESTKKGSIKDGVSFEMVQVTKGTFQMGASETEEGYGNERPQHPVEISRDFFMAATEVTFGQFRQFVKETRYETEGEKGPQASTVKLLGKHGMR